MFTERIALPWRPFMISGVRRAIKSQELIIRSIKKYHPWKTVEEQLVNTFIETNLNRCGNVDVAARVFVLGSNLVGRQPRAAIEGIDI